MNFRNDHEDSNHWFLAVLFVTLAGMVVLFAWLLRLLYHAGLFLV